MTTPTCATCRHWKAPRAEPWVLGRVVIGTCEIGGPEQDGCSDVHRDETCERHEQKERP